MAATENVEISDESISCLQNQIEDLSFVDSIYKLKVYSCCVCKNVAISHCISNCKSVFCTKCYQKFYKQPCPDCNLTVLTNEQDTDFKNEVFELKVKCKFARNGCEEIVLLKNYLEHLGLCKFAPERIFPKLYRFDKTAEAIEKLTNDVHNIKESMQLIPTVPEELNGMLQKLTDTTESMQTEIRKLKDAVQQCEISGNELKNENQTEIQNLESRIQEGQQKVKQENKKEIQKIQLENKEEIQKLESIIQALKEENKKDIQEIQLKNDAEMQMVKSHQDNRIRGLELNLTVLQYFHQDYYGCEPPCIYLWKVPEFQKKLQTFMGKDPVNFRSETSFIAPNGLQFKPKLYTNSVNEYVIIGITFTTDINTVNGKCSVPYLHSRKFVMLDQSAAAIKENVEMIDRPNFKKNSENDMLVSSFISTYFFPLSILKSENKYIKNDQIQIKIIIEPIALLWKQIATNDGNFLWRINNYSKKKRDEINGIRILLISEPFKTSHTGYTMQVETYLNGESDAKGKYISILLRLILGEHDDLLPLPFHCKSNFCLLDQSDSSKKRNISLESNHEFRQGALNIGFPSFVLQSRAEDPKYLRNDSLSFQITVKIL